MDKEQLKQALSELFSNGEIEIKLVTTLVSGRTHIFPEVLIDGNEVFVGEAEQY